MKFILGTKGKMTTVFTEDGRSFAATIINVSPAVVTQIKTPEKDGYTYTSTNIPTLREVRVKRKTKTGLKSDRFLFFKLFESSMRFKYLFYLCPSYL